MNPTAHDDELRGAFRRLRDRDEARAAPFATAWSVAARRAAAGRPRRHPYWQAAAAAALLVAVVMFDRSAPLEKPHATQRKTQIADAPLSEWRAPTDVLLVTFDRELMRSVPRLGAPPIDWKVRTTEES